VSQRTDQAALWPFTGSSSYKDIFVQELDRTHVDVAPELQLE